MESSQFFMVWVEGQRPPAYKHATLEDAESECNRLVLKTGQRVYVLKAIEQMETLPVVKVVVTSLEPI